ncbi:MAG TPA: gamma-glutamyltransferase, partial [Longimicrobiales bacterium]|nr:gamma-glutamyltransferase [Longimicrobiales bacterium]
MTGRRPHAPLLVVTALLAACQAPPPAVGGDADAPFYPATNRPDVRGTHGAVSSDHPLAAQAGLEVLKEGGNAVDAAVAMAAVLAVVRPHMNGVGGDAFVLYYDGASGQVTALNGSGRAGALATPAFFAERGLDEVPSTGALSVSVPGAVAAWVDIHRRFGTLPFARLLAPAIGYARDGFPVSWRLAEDIRTQGDALNEAGKAQYMPGGAPPPVGSLLKNPALAATLERIARQGKAGFYQGPVAERLGAFLEAEGGYLRASDFAAHTSTWVEPLRGEYLDHEVLAMPPATQGITQIQMFEMAKTFPLKEMGYNTSRYLHTLVEVKKLAFADRDRWVGDPEKADVPVDRLLDPGYLTRRAALVDPEHAAASVEPGFGDGEPSGSGDRDDRGDTVYLTVVDAHGNAVSWIQSLFAGFGSGLFEPETGVMLQNRGSLFVLTEGHPDRIAPDKRPFHTLSPLLVLRDGRLAFTLGTPGGDSQPQSLLQIVNNLLLFDMTPQEAVEAPRFRSNSGLNLQVEYRIPASVRGELAALGHDVRVVQGWTATFGGAQMIRVEPG